MDEKIITLKVVVFSQRFFAFQFQSEEKEIILIEE